MSKQQFEMIQYVCSDLMNASVIQIIRFLLFVLFGLPFSTNFVIVKWTDAVWFTHQEQTVCYVLLVGGLQTSHVGGLERSKHELQEFC